MRPSPTAVTHPPARETSAAKAVAKVNAPGP